MDCRQQPVTDDFLSSGPGLWHLSAFPSTSPLLPPYWQFPLTHPFLLHPFALLPTPPHLPPPSSGAWITQCFTQFAGNPSSLKASRVLSHLRLLCLSVSLDIAIHTHASSPLIPLTPWWPPGSNLCCPWVRAEARKDREVGGSWQGSRKPRGAFTGKSIRDWITLSWIHTENKRLAIHFQTPTLYLSVEFSCLSFWIKITWWKMKNGTALDHMVLIMIRLFWVTNGDVDLRRSYHFPKSKYYRIAKNTKPPL